MTEEQIKPQLPDLIAENHLVGRTSYATILFTILRGHRTSAASATLKSVMVNRKRMENKALNLMCAIKNCFIFIGFRDASRKRQCERDEIQSSRTKKSTVVAHFDQTDEVIVNNKAKTKQRKPSIETFLYTF